MKLTACQKRMVILRVSGSQSGRVRFGRSKCGLGMRLTLVAAQINPGDAGVFTLYQVIPLMVTELPAWYVVCEAVRGGVDDAGPRLWEGISFWVFHVL